MGQDLTGRRFGMLVVQEEIELVKDKRGHPVRRFRCRCDCGTEKIFRYNNLLSGKPTAVDVHDFQSSRPSISLVEGSALSSSYQKLKNISRRTAVNCADGTASVTAVT